jgi:hypothetical protein|tara:strand:- start:7723 stop:8727 length:1005 start_codon:yes stop_codon:yes gene_type:complete
MVTQQIGHTEYTFPDETDKDTAIEVEPSSAKVLESEKDASDAIEIEVVDDTPEEDRGRTASPPPGEVTDEELASYSESVQKRIRRFTKGYNDERREKEKAQRERQEMERYALQLVEENTKLKGSVGKSQTALLEQAKRAVSSDIERAKVKYKEAYESGESDAVIAAQEQLTAAKIRADRIDNFKLPALQKEETEVKGEQSSVPNAPEPNEKSKQWYESNKWFGTDGPKTGYALGLHEQLVTTEGFDPNSDEYYEAIDSRMRSAFPDSFDGNDGGETSTSPKRSSNVVASAKRSVAPKKVRLTQTQVNIAERLGVPLDLYAQKVAEQSENTDGRK